MGRRLRSVVAVGMLVALGASASAADAATFDVAAGPPLREPPRGVPRDATVNDFYPRDIAVHPGDRVRFRLFGFHNIVFPAGGQPVPPLITPDPSTPVAGALDAAGAPFWFNGQPRLILDPRSAFPTGGSTVDGRGLVSSGLPGEEGEPEPFVARFPKRGRFSYFCTVHPGMRGKVRVLRRSQRVPTAAQNRRRVNRQLRTQIIRLRKLDSFAGPRGNALQAGSDQGKVAILRFFPQRKTVPAGTTVRLQMPRNSSEIHTFSFGPEPYLEQIASEPFAPQVTPGAQGPPTLVANPLTFYPSDPLPLPPHTGTNHGNGFLNTGPLLRAPGRGGPFPGSTDVVFTTPGTFGFICLIHPEMKATVEVT